MDRRSAGRLPIGATTDGDAAAMAVCGALAGWTVHGLMDFDLYSPGVALPAFILLGIVQGLKEIPRTDSVNSSRRRENWLVGAICAFVLVAVLWIEVRALAAGVILDDAHEWAGFGSPALDDIKTATRLAPWNPRFQLILGQVALQAGKSDEAIAAYRQAIQDDPYRASGWWRLAEAKKATHHMDTEVLELLHKAHELNPMNKRYSQALAAVEESVRQSHPALLESIPAKENGSSKQ